MLEDGALNKAELKALEQIRDDMHAVAGNVSKLVDAAKGQPLAASVHVQELTVEQVREDPKEESRLKSVNERLEDLGIAFKAGGVVDINFDMFTDALGAQQCRELAAIIAEKWGE